MARVSTSVVRRARHRKWLKRAKGYRGRRRTVFKLAKEAVLKAGQHAYYDRRKKKAAFRATWHVVINAAVRKHGLSFSRFMNQLNTKEIKLNRKVLAQLAQEHPDIFDKVVETASK